MNHAPDTQPLLVQAVKSHLPIVMNWFHDRDSAQRWGGPKMRFPFHPRQFVHDVQWDRWHNYVLLRPEAHSSLATATVVAFGQVIQRLNRHHLGRLAVAPEARGQGYGRLLIRNLLHAAQGHARLLEASLLVYKDNLPAWHCYRGLGFEETAYPPGMPFLENVAFMTLKLE